MIYHQLLYLSWRDGNKGMTIVIQRNLIWICMQHKGISNGTEMIRVNRERHGGEGGSE